MRPHMSCLLVFVASLTACGKDTAGDLASGIPADGKVGTTAASASTDPARSAAATNGETNPASSSSNGKYQLLGVKDPDFGIIAFAMKIPRGWAAKQAFQRQWDGANPWNQVYVVFRSADSGQQIEYLPASKYVYSDGPGPNNLRMQKQSMGIDPRMAENELAPMPALAYISRVLLPQLAQNGLTLRDVGNERETAPHSVPTPGSDTPHMESSASVDGVLPNGNRGRVEIRIGWSEVRNNQDIYYSWWATPSITQTGNGDLDATYAHTETSRTTLAYNPEWLRKDRELAEKGNRATTEALTRSHAANMENIAQWGRINKANAAASMERINANAAASAARQEQQFSNSNARMAANDRANELFLDVVIDGKAKYENPTTGERVKVDSNYNHTYTDNAGYYYQTNTPLKSSDVDWQEMEKVPFDDY